MARNSGISKKVDIHGMTKEEARRYLLSEIENAPVSLREIVVVHGCNSGTALQLMVRKQLHSPRIHSMLPALADDGITIIYLK